MHYFLNVDIIEPWENMMFALLGAEDWVPTLTVRLKLSLLVAYAF